MITQSRLIGWNACVLSHIQNIHMTFPHVPNQRTKFTLYNLAGEEKAYYLVDQVNISVKLNYIPTGDLTENPRPKLAIIIEEEEPENGDYAYQIFFSTSVKRLERINPHRKILELQPGDKGIIYKYKQLTKNVYEQLSDIPVAQNHQSVYVFARSNLSEGNLNTAKYAIASTFNLTLLERHTKALTKQDLVDFAQDIDIVLYHPNILTRHTILEQMQINHKISLIELLEILNEHHKDMILNLKHLQENYQRQGLKRVKGVRDTNGEIVQPWLSTENINESDYVGMGTFQFNHNTATINMLIKRQVKLVKVADKTQISEVAGLLVNHLANYNKYTIVSDGNINVRSLNVKISNKKVFDLLKSKAVIKADEFDFRAEYTIQLDNLPLVSFRENFSNLDGLFIQLAEIKILSSILAAHLREESDMFIDSQVDELKKHYLSKNLYVNFPTTTEYTNLNTALKDQTVESHLRYKIDIGNLEILNLNKLYSANKFLDRRYQAYDQQTGEVSPKASFKGLCGENIAFRPKAISSRMKITKVDELMKSIFDDFLRLEDNGKVTAILHQVGADSLALLLQARRAGKTVSQEEMVAAMTVAYNKLGECAEKIYQEKISPLVFYIGSTGLLPEELAAKMITAEELATQYPDLQFSKYEQEGTFFVVGNSIIGIYSQIEYSSKKIPMSA